MLKTVSICICTSGRPAELDRCLASIQSGTVLPHEVIVSDDCRDASTVSEVRAVCDRYSFVRYTTGPQRGLCANRNQVIRQATGTHVSLLDDDATVSADFVERAEALIVSQPDVIWTGDVLENGVRLQSPTNPRFLGHFGRPVKIGDRLENINLNSNILPRNAFARVRFDESIAYGYEDTDLCAQLIACGYAIKHEPNLVNCHLPPGTDKQLLRQRHRLAEQARLKVLWRRWAIHRRRPFTASVIWCVAALHRLCHQSIAMLKREATL